MDNNWYPGELEETGHLRHLECPLSILSRFLSLLPLLKLLIPASVQSPHTLNSNVALPPFALTLLSLPQAGISPPQALCSCRLPAALHRLFSLLCLQSCLFLECFPQRHHQASSYSSSRYVLRHDTLQEAFLKNLDSSPDTQAWAYVHTDLKIMCPSPGWRSKIPSGRALVLSDSEDLAPDTGCVHRHSANVGRTDLVPDSHGSAQMFGSDSHPCVSLFVAETSTRETKHHTRRAGELRFITAVGREELTLQALSPEQRDYSFYGQTVVASTSW